VRREEALEAAFASALLPVPKPATGKHAAPSHALSNLFRFGTLRRAPCVVRRAPCAVRRALLHADCFCLHGTASQTACPMSARTRFP
jgi:hypothetical protein